MSPDRRAFQGVQTVPLVGGLLCLDFVNSTGARRSGAPRERLRSPGDLLTWARRTRILSAGGRLPFERLLRRRPREADAGLARVLELRECLYRTFVASIAGDAPRASDLALLQRWADRVACCRRLAWRGQRLRWEWTAETDLEALCGPVVHSAVELMAEGRLSVLKKCGECDWLFMDGTKNQSRNWCKKACRDRVKSRRYYRRKARERRGRSGE